MEGKAGANDSRSKTPVQKFLPVQNPMSVPNHQNAQS
jgi:hypothetical protein